jgi:hypothetical protein
LGGPFTILLLRPYTWPINTFFRTFGHESSHIFHAFDEYSSSDPSNCTYSFNSMMNANYEGPPCYGTQSCLMIDNSFIGSGGNRQWNLCNETKSHIGWQNLAPAPTPVSPINNLGVSAGIVTFTWNRNTSNADINSLIRVCDTLGNIIDCSVLGTASSAQSYLTTGVYRWQAINGTDLLDGGYAEVSSPVYTLYVGLSGIAEADNNFPVDIFPNPAEDKVTIRNLLSGINKIEIYNITGQKIFSDEVRKTNGNAYSLNVGAFNAGFYMVSVTNNGQRKLAHLLIH